MKIAIYCVTYHTYQELDAYLSNIEENLQGCTQIELSVNVCDNTEGEILPINYQPKRFTINVFGVHRNLGYFGGIRYMMEKVNPEDFDISIISNVDVAISDDFFLRLQKLPIRQEHGSFIILTKEYFKRCGIINYPCFLFCEEIYLGEQCKEHQLAVVYEPSLRIDDDEHASTGNFKGKKYCQFNYQALSYIIKKYY